VSQAVPRLWAVIPAAGRGERFGGGLPKQYARLRGRSVIEWSLAPFLARDDLAGIVVALAADDREWARCRPADPRLIEAPGGAERAQSVSSALTLIVRRGGDDQDLVLVHDAARPCLHPEDLDGLLVSGRTSSDGALLAVPVEDTLKQAEDGRSVRTVDRRQLWRALTPQLFRLGALRRALDAARAEHVRVTDEASAVEHQGGKPLLIAGRADNIKVTRPADLGLAEAVLEARERQTCG
jgi:2-C-methyl-D-erythritol 4-phosphate cytidylyltransferase